MCQTSVFAAIRLDAKQSVLCLVNLSGETIAIDAELPAAFPAPRSGKVWDAVSGVSADLVGNRLRWSLASYETAFLTGSPAALPKNALPAVSSAQPLPASPSATFSHRQGDLLLELDLPGWESGDHPAAPRRTFTSQQGTVIIEERTEGIAVTADLVATRENPGLTLTVRGAQRWSVSGRTAFLDDLVLRRHYPFPAESGYSWQRGQAWGHLPWGGLYQGVSPGGRFWQTLVEPLHPERPALSFADAQGRGFAICGLRTHAMNVVLTDATDEVPEPERLELRILGIDPDLALSVQRFGRGQPWQLAGLKPVESRPLHAEFLLRTTESQQELAALLAAPRLPLEPSGADLVVDAPKVSDMGGRQFLPEPGSFTWNGLAPVDGRFEIELELRLSEASATDTDLADAYEIALDGQVLPVTWGQKDVWHTGNAFFAKARIGPVDLGGERHQLRLRTLRPWCAFRPEFQLIPSGNGQPPSSTPPISGAGAGRR